MASINVTVGMTPQMLAAVDEEWEDDPRFGSRAEYIRACVRSDTEIQRPCEQHEIKDATRIPHHLTRRFSSTTPPAV